MESRPPDTASTTGLPVAIFTSASSGRMHRNVAVSGASLHWPATRAFPTLDATGASTSFPADLAQMETSGGPLGILWTGLGLGGFYIALIWVNSLLGMVLTPLFLLPVTFLMDRKKKGAKS